MSAPFFVSHCKACGKPHSLYISSISPEILQEEKQELQEQVTYLGQQCISLSERLVLAESMAVWDGTDTTSIADLLG